MPQQTAVVFVNAASTRGDQDLDEGLAVLDAAGIAAEVERIEQPAALPGRIAARAAASDIVIVGGGDGTMAAAAGALLGSGRPLGILPLGNSCDFARSLGIPRDIAEACAVIARGQRRAIDVARVNGRAYLNMASLGVSVEVARAMTNEVKKRWGVLAYPVLLWRAMRAARPFRVNLECDGMRRRLRVVQLGIGNGFFYGSGMTVSEDARLDDGLLHVHGIAPVPWWHYLMLLPRIRAGRFREPREIEAMTCRRISVATVRPRTVNADGELAARTPALFEVLPRALEVFVPAAAETPGLDP